MRNKTQIQAKLAEIEQRLVHLDPDEDDLMWEYHILEAHTEALKWVLELELN